VRRSLNSSSVICRAARIAKRLGVGSAGLLLQLLDAAVQVGGHFACGTLVLVASQHETLSRNLYGYWRLHVDVALVQGPDVKWGGALPRFGVRGETQRRQHTRSSKLTSLNRMPMPPMRAASLTQRTSPCSL